MAEWEAVVAPVDRDNTARLREIVVRYGWPGSRLAGEAGAPDLSHLSVSGTTALNGGLVSTTGTQTYTGAVTLKTNTTLNANNGGSIKLGSTVDDTTTAGSEGLATSGRVEFDGAVGGTLALGSLSTNNTTTFNAK